MNLSFDFIPINFIKEDDDGTIGNIYDNKTGDGILGSVLHNETDIGFAAFFIWYRESQFIGYSKSISRIGVTCIVLKPKLASGWLIAISPFSYKLWIAIFVGFFAGLISLIILIKIANENFVSKTASDVGWIVFNIYLWQSVNIMQVILCFYQVVLFIFLLHILQKISYFSNNCLCRFNHFKLYHWKSLWE